MNRIQPSPAWLQEIYGFETCILPENSKWGRVIARWNEKISDNVVLNHRFSFCVNLANGDFFLDCSKKKIFAKMVVLTILRPLDAAIKTLFHLSLLGVAIALYKGVSKKQSAWTVIKNCGKEIADIVRTPLYGIALTVMSIAAIVFAVFDSASLYTMRDLMGRMEQSLYWGEQHRYGTLAPCFQPLLKITNDHYGIEWWKDAVAEKERGAALSIDILKRKLIDEKLDPKKHPKNCLNLFAAEKAYYDIKLAQTKEIANNGVSPRLGVTQYDEGFEGHMHLQIQVLANLRFYGQDCVDQEHLVVKLQNRAYLELRLTNAVLRDIVFKRQFILNPFVQCGTFPNDKAYVSPVLV